MKTLLIYNDIESPIKFALIDGDYSRFDGVCINSMDEHPFNNECCNFIFNKEGNFNIQFTEDKDLLLGKEWDTVAIITFLP